MSMLLMKCRVTSQTKLVIGMIFASLSCLVLLMLSSALAQETSKSPVSTADYFAEIAQNNSNMALSAGAATMGGSFSTSNILAGIVFGAIGLAAFIYGKKRILWWPMALGIALMVFPYFPMSTLVLYLIGAALTAALFIWRD